MEKLLPQFLLFVSLTFLVGCTITKRRYKSGYYVNWHKKSPDARPFVQSQKPEPASNKIVCSGRSSEKNGAAQKIEISNTCKSLQPISTIPNEKWITKIVRDNLIPKIVSSTYTVTPENIPGHNQPEKDTTTKFGTVAYIFFTLGILSFLALILIVLSGNFFILSTGCLLLILLLLVSLILSIVFSFLAMKDRENIGLVIVAIVDIAGLLFSIIIIGALIVNL